MLWSLEDYCNSQEPIDLTLLEPSSRDFLDALNLPSIHPFCSDEGPSFQVEGVPPMGDLEYGFQDETIFQGMITMWYMIAPPLLAMTELWLRLFAGSLSPLGILYLTMDECKGPSRKDSDAKIVSFVSVLSVASSLVLMTDTLYVLENGPCLGVALFGVSLLLSLRAFRRYDLFKSSIILYCILLLAMHLVWDSKTGSLTFGDKVDEVKIGEGLYFNPANDFVLSLVKNWPEHYRVYNTATGATRWTLTGDARTGFPFLLNHVPNLDWNRVFLKTFDEEYVALDIVFPPDGHDSTKPVYLLFHGLNGGSNEEYIKDISQRRITDGSTVVVMVARGLMSLPVKGWDIFHGARTMDAHAAALIVRQAIGPNQTLIAAGYSMGAIILSNYVASYGPDCVLDGAIALSGGLDMRYQEHFSRAQRLWQPMLANTLKNDFLLGKWGYRLRERLSEFEMLRMMRSRHITEIDRIAVVAYNGFDDLLHYYREMSALGDISHMQDGLLEPNNTGKIHTVSIPLCLVQALDDPLVTWKATASNKGFMHPENLVLSGSGNVMVLLTKAGGHVGWPLGDIPSMNNWKWMSDVVMSFAHAIDTSKRLDAGDRERPIPTSKAGS